MQLNKIKDGNPAHVVCAVRRAKACSACTEASVASARNIASAEPLRTESHDAVHRTISVRASGCKARAASNCQVPHWGLVLPASVSWRPVHLLPKYAIELTVTAYLELSAQVHRNGGCKLCHAGQECLLPKASRVLYLFHTIPACAYAPPGGADERAPTFSNE